MPGPLDASAIAAALTDPAQRAGVVAAAADLQQFAATIQPAIASVKALFDDLAAIEALIASHAKPPT